MFDSIHWHIYGFTGVVDEVTGFGVIGNILGNMRVEPSTVLTVAAIAYAALIIIAYFIGNISPSTILAKSKGLDIKSEGSGNAGTTNALRVMGKKAGIITLVIDILKGVLAVVLAEVLAGEVCGMYAAVAVILGHVWPLVYRFKGGKGVATTFGALLAINPVLGLITLAVVAIVTFLSKRMSAGSIAGAICFPVICLFNEPEFIVQGTLLAIIVLVKHRANIGRLLEGEEPKLSFLDKDAKAAKEAAAEADTEQEPVETVESEVTEVEIEEELVETVETEAEATEEAEPEVIDEPAAEDVAEEPVAEEADNAEEAAEEIAEEESVEAEEAEQIVETEPEIDVQEEKTVAEEEPTADKDVAEEPADEKTAEEKEAEKPTYKKPVENKDTRTKKNGKKKKSYPNKHKNNGNKSGGNKNGSKNKNNKKSNSKGNGKKGNSKKKGGKKK